jgi:uncharacterized protein
METPDTEPTEEEFDQLEIFLEESEPHEGMPLDAIDGMFAAVACGPELIMPSEWMPAIWRGHTPEWDSIEDAQGMLDIIMKWYNSVVRAVNAGKYEPMMTVWEDPETEEEVEDPEDWCLGFIEGMKFRSGAWEEQVKADPQLQDMLEPVFLVADADDDFARSLLDARVRRGLIERMIDGVSDIRDYWLARAQPT